jgi:hypothetical protein
MWSYLVKCFAPRIDFCFSGVGRFTAAVTVVDVVPFFFGSTGLLPSRRIARFSNSYFEWIVVTASLSHYACSGEIATGPPARWQGE